MNAAPSTVQVSSPDTTISSAVVRALFVAVEQAGISRTQLLTTAQLGSEGLGDAEARISASKAYELCVLALDLTDDPALWLHWAESLTTSALTPVSHLIARSASSA